MVSTVALRKEDAFENQEPAARRSRAVPQLLRKSRAEAPDDRRFAEAVYRATIADGTMEGITYQDLAGTGDAA